MHAPLYLVEPEDRPDSIEALERILEVDAEPWGTGRGTRTWRRVVEQRLASTYPTAG